MVRGVIFDLGNTLMHFQGDWDVVTAAGIARLFDFLREQGLELPGTFADDFLAHRQRGRELSARSDVEYTAQDALRDTLSLYGNASLPLEIAREALRRFFGPEQDQWVAYEDAQATVKRLRALGLRLGVISNATDDEFVHEAVRRAGLDLFFHPIISSAGVPWRKPDPRIFQHVLDTWDLPPEDVAMVGDWPSTDILGAHRAGMPAILIDERWPEPPHLHAPVIDAELLRPDAVVFALDELPDTLARLDGSLKPATRS